jgi:hypothetical protein
MNCDEVKRMLDAYPDGDLDLTRQLDVETHPPSCFAPLSARRLELPALVSISVALPLCGEGTMAAD